MYLTKAKSLFAAAALALLAVSGNSDEQQIKLDASAVRNQIHRAISEGG